MNNVSDFSKAKTTKLQRIEKKETVPDLRLGEEISPVFTSYTPFQITMKVFNWH